MNEAEYTYKIKALEEWLAEETLVPTLSTQDYLKVWNKKHSLERQRTVEYAAAMIAVKTANSDMCLEAFK